MEISFLQNSILLNVCQFVFILSFVCAESSLDYKAFVVASCRFELFSHFISPAFDIKGITFLFNSSSTLAWTDVSDTISTWEVIDFLLGTLPPREFVLKKFDVYWVQLSRVFCRLVRLSVT